MNEGFFGFNKETGCNSIEGFTENPYKKSMLWLSNEKWTSIHSLYGSKIPSNDNHQRKIY
ncbi:hypothetical protein [Aureibaculum conchae]|uniref:hypothetical protein n=1 Tax=Aureibaculum sp. 2308TA14-22 TaxID=3108392 RepID=UPI003393F05C